MTLATETPKIETELPPPSPKPKKRRQTAGEIVVERGIFTGVGFGVNEISSLWITNQFVKGRNLLAKAPSALQWTGSWFSREGYEWISHKLADMLKIADKAGKNGKTVKGWERAGNTLLMVMLLSGGTLLIWPMKKMKDNEEYLVRKVNHFFDRLRGNKMTLDEVEARDAEVDKALACKPKQSWSTMLPARAIAMMASVGSGMLVGKARNDRLQEGAAHAARGVAEGANIIVGGKQNSFFARLARSERFRDYTGLAAVETYSCAIASIVLEVVSKIFARHGTTVHNPALCHENEDADLPAATGSAGGEKAAPGKYASTITPASRDTLAPASSHAERSRQNETSHSLSA